jgi:hypothetical protein
MVSREHRVLHPCPLQVVPHHRFDHRGDDIQGDVAPDSVLCPDFSGWPMNALVMRTRFARFVITSR